MTTSVDVDQAPNTVTERQHRRRHWTAPNESSLCQGLLLKPKFGRVRSTGRAGCRSVVGGSGSGFAEEPVVGCETGHAGL